MTRRRTRVHRQLNSIRKVLSASTARRVRHGRPSSPVFHVTKSLQQYLSCSSEPVEFHVTIGQILSNKPILADRYRAAISLFYPQHLVEAFESAVGKIDEPPSSEPLTRKRLKLLCELAWVSDLPISMLIHQTGAEAMRTLDRFRLPEPLYTPHKAIVQKPDGTTDTIESYET